MLGDMTYSGASPGGMTMLMTSDISLYFMIRSEAVVDVREGDAFTWGTDRQPVTITQAPVV